MILMENKNFSAVHGSSQAPYFNSLARQCGYSTSFMDNMFDTTDQLSLPHYLALTSGSNCNTGVNSTGTGCIQDDGNPSSHVLSTQSIFNQVASWRAYQESMPSACYGSGSGAYQPKHNPPPYYTAISTCSANDVPIAAVTCPTTVNTVCSSPSNVLTQDLANDTLPAYSFITPNQTNDMHDGTVAQGDNWLHTYLPLIFQSPAYLRGEVAVYVMWDEGSPNNPQPNLFITPYTAPTVSSTTMNLFSVLRANEEQLGIHTHLGCASGTPPGGVGTCAAGSTVDIRPVFNF
jgi:acid phosphatase